MTATEPMENKPGKRTPENLSVARIYSVAAVLVLVGGLVFYRIAHNQVLTGNQGKDFLQAQGDARALRVEPIVALRGMITDRYGEPLAVSTPVTTLWANPKFLAQEKRSLRPLANALGLSEAELRQKLVPGREFVYLKRQIAPDDAERVLALNYKGVFGEREYRRFYPAAEVTSQLVGFTDIDDNGREGVELAYDSVLKGHMGSKRVLKDLSGRVIKDVQLVKSAEPGKDIQLSIDLRIQYFAYRELKRAIAEYKAKAGSVVVLDSLTGEVLALVNQPDYNPNNRKDLQPEDLRNRAITDVFEPGSTIKPFTMVTALESGRYTPHTMVDTNPGRITIEDKTFLDHTNYGVIDLTHIIAKSSQVGAIKVGLSLQGNDLRSTLYRVGFGQATGSGFPGEGIGVLPSYRHWPPIEQATISFGLGLSVSALQLAHAYAVLANSGVKKPLSLLRQDAATTAAGEAVLSPRITQQVLTMMEAVTEPGGTATRASIAAYNVAGKTGTAHKAAIGGYSADKYVALFAGIAPATHPRFVAVVMIDEPMGDEYYGGEVAAPVFSQVMSTTLRLYGVPPDNVPQQAGTGKAPEPKKRVS